MTNEKSKTITDLERERNKILEDLQSLKQAHERRKQTASPVPVRARKGEWLQLSTQLKEANLICKRLHKDVVFRRVGALLDSEPPRIQAHHVGPDLVCLWALDVFQDRLELLRDLWQNGSDSGLSFERIILEDPSDVWAPPANPDGVSEHPLLSVGLGSAEHANRPHACSVCSSLIFYPSARW